jgi:beta-glucosidase
VSLLDNCEWALGFRKRFGVVHLDYATQVRKIKDSGYAYSSFIRNGSRARQTADRPGLSRTAR